jgi:predicted  nucleic acid-binding Zn-ribbon protein
MNEAERLERAIECLREDSTLVRESIARLMAQFELWQSSNDKIQDELKEIRNVISKHSEHDAHIQSELRAELKRIWWGAGIGLTAMGGAAATLVIKYIV